MSFLQHFALEELRPPAPPEATAPPPIAAAGFKLRSLFSGLFATAAGDGDGSRKFSFEELQHLYDVSVWAVCPRA